MGIIFLKQVSQHTLKKGILSKVILGVPKIKLFGETPPNRIYVNLIKFASEGFKASSDVFVKHVVAYI